MLIEEYIAKQPIERQNVMKAIHELIISHDKKVEPKVGLMMGKEMILYNCKTMMKYGFASGKNGMTLHLMPIYGSSKLHDKYKSLLKKAKFQKGCINFNDEAEMPMDIVKQLIMDCSAIDLLKIKEEYLKSKKV